MKTKHYLITGAFSLTLAALIFAGCSKNTTTTSSTDTTAAQDDANASFAIQDSKNIADGAAKGQAQERLMSGCETIRKILPDTIINSQADSAIDIFFGNSDCKCLDNRNRRGHIIVYWPVGTHHYFDSGATISMTFNNYAVNDIGVTGTRTITNAGKNTQGSQSWNLTANLTLTYPNNGGTATWVVNNRTNTLAQTGGVWYFQVTGSASGTSRKGATYSITVTSPLYVVVPSWLIAANAGHDCSYIEYGQLTISVSTFSYPVYVTYGTSLGACSNAATATINGVQFNFTQQ